MDLNKSFFKLIIEEKYTVIYFYYYSRILVKISSNLIAFQSTIGETLQDGAFLRKE